MIRPDVTPEEFVRAVRAAQYHHKDLMHASPDLAAQRPTVAALFVPAGSPEGEMDQDAARWRWLRWRSGTFSYDDPNGERAGMTMTRWGGAVFADWEVLFDAAMREDPIPAPSPSGVPSVESGAELTDAGIDFAIDCIDGEETREHVRGLVMPLLASLRVALTQKEQQNAVLTIDNDGLMKSERHLLKVSAAAIQRAEEAEQKFQRSTQRSGSEPKYFPKGMIEWAPGWYAAIGVAAPKQIPGRPIVWTKRYEFAGHTEQGVNFYIGEERAPLVEQVEDEG